MKFTLQDRLDKAAADRRLAAGLPPDTTTAAPTAPAATAPAGEAPIIDLRTPEPTAPIALGTSGGPATERDDERDDERDHERGDALEPLPTPLPNRRDGGGGLPVWQGADQPARDTPWQLSSGGTTLTAHTARPAELASEPVPSTAPLKDRCPNCRGAVRLDMFDLVEAVAHMSCVDCGFLYTTKSPKL